MIVHPVMLRCEFTSARASPPLIPSTLYAGDATLPATSTLNFRAGRTRANNAVIPLASNGDGTLKVRAVILGGGSTHYLIDVSGYLK